MDYFEFAEDAFKRINDAGCFMHLALDMFTERYELEMEIMGKMNRFNLKWGRKFKECKAPELETCRELIDRLLNETSVTRSLSIVLAEGYKEPFGNFKNFRYLYSFWVEEKFGNDAIGHSLAYNYQKDRIPFKGRYSSEKLSEMVMVNLKSHFKRYQEKRLRMFFKYIEEFATWLKNVDQQKQQRQNQLNSVFSLIQVTDVKKEIANWHVGIMDREPCRDYAEFKQKERDYTTHNVEMTSNQKSLDGFTFGRKRQTAQNTRETKVDKFLSVKEKLSKEIIRKKDVGSTKATDLKLVKDGLLETGKRKSSVWIEKKKEVATLPTDNVKFQERRLKSSLVLEANPVMIGQRNENPDIVDQMQKEMDSQTKVSTTKGTITETNADKFSSIKDTPLKEGIRKKNIGATKSNDLDLVEDQCLEEDRRTSLKLKEEKKQVEINIIQTDDIQVEERRLESSKEPQAHQAINDGIKDDINMVDGMLEEIEDHTKEHKLSDPKTDTFSSIKYTLIKELKESLRKKNIQATESNNMQLVESELLEEDKRKFSKRKEENNDVEKNILPADDFKIEKRRLKSSKVYKTHRVIIDEIKDDFDVVMIKEIDDQTKFLSVKERLLEELKQTFRKKDILAAKLNVVQLVKDELLEEDKNIFSKLKEEKKEVEKNINSTDQVKVKKCKSKSSKVFKTCLSTIHEKEEDTDMVVKMLKETEDPKEEQQNDDDNMKLLEQEILNRSETTNSKSKVREHVTDDETKDLHLVEEVISKEAKRIKPKSKQKEQKDVILLDDIQKDTEDSGKENDREMKGRPQAMERKMGDRESDNCGSWNDNEVTETRNRKVFMKKDGKEEKDPDSKSRKAVKMVALKDYTAKTDCQISFSAGHIIRQQCPANDDGLAYVYVKKGIMKRKRFGYYPAASVTTKKKYSEIKIKEKKNKEKNSMYGKKGKKDKIIKLKKAEKEESPETGKAEKMVALQKHVAQTDQEISFKAGQVVRQQIPANEDGWAFGYIEKGLMKKHIYGYYPGSFVLAKKEYAGNS